MAAVNGCLSAEYILQGIAQQLTELGKNSGPKVGYECALNAEWKLP
jgi:hypothetical protein